VFDLLSATRTGRLFLFASFILLVYVFVLATVLGTLALAARRAGPPDLYRIGPVVFRFRPIRLRLRLWQFMVAIFALGALFESVVLVRHAAYAYNKAVDHANEASDYRSLQKLSWLLSADSDLVAGKTSTASLVKYYQAKEGYHERMSQKYFYLARHPWSSMSPDPPEVDLKEQLLHELSSLEVQQSP
jgi:hypothetical protein